MFREAILKDVRKTLDKSTILRVNVPVDVISIFYVSAVINVCIEYIREPGKYTMQEILDYLDKLIPNDIYFDNIKTTPIEV